MSVLLFGILLYFFTFLKFTSKSRYVRPPRFQPRGRSAGQPPSPPATRQPPSPPPPPYPPAPTPMAGSKTYPQRTVGRRTEHLRSRRRVQGDHRVDGSRMAHQGRHPYVRISLPNLARETTECFYGITWSRPVAGMRRHLKAKHRFAV